MGKILEQQTNDCMIFGTKENYFGGATENECEHCDYKIQKLEQQTSENAISRQAVNEYLEKLLDGRFDDFMSAAIIGIKDNINAMPPVTPTFPKGATNYDVLKAVFGNTSAFRIKDTMEFEKGFELWFSKPYKRGDIDGSN